jgi:hypothetical protein
MTGIREERPIARSTPAQSWTLGLASIASFVVVHGPDGRLPQGGGGRLTMAPSV